MHRLLALPDRQGWALSALIFLCFAGVALPFGFAVGLFEWAPDAEGLLLVALVALIVPALVEELVFRAPLLWAPDYMILIVAGWLLGLFVLWHPLNALLFLTDARDVFWDPRFLVIAAGLGLACMLATAMTRSIAPAILIHWLTVVAWKGLLGGEMYLK